MRVLNNIIALLYILGTIVLGLILILSVSGMYGLKESIELMVNEQLNSPTGIFTGCVFVILGLLFLSIHLNVEKAGRTISFDNPEGEVSISVKAIEDFVKRVGQEFSQVIEMVPTIIPVRDGIKVKARIVLVAGANVPRLTESIQHTIKSRMQNILGIENVVGVQINVSKLVIKEGVAEEPAQQTLDIG